MYFLNFSVAIEFGVFTFQSFLLFRAYEICESPIIPTWKVKNCWGKVTLLYSCNAAFLLLYLYFCCVTYEHYWMGLKNPKFIVREAQILAEEKKQRELE